jgi:DNA uptake protein ComE-like DNA-binding protein/ribosomal protein L22
LQKIFIKQLNGITIIYKPEIHMKSIRRFLALAVASVLLVVLTNCSQSPDTGVTSNSSPASNPSPAATSTHSSAHSKDKININTAILSELDKLEAKLGIPALSNKIQASRPYGTPDELVSKKVISQEQFDQIKEIVTVEDIVLTGEAKDVDYMSKLGLMKGHLLVAKELLDAKLPKQAEPHIGHPVEEIYLDVEEQFNERKVPEFKTALIGLQDMVKSNPKNAKVATNFDQSMQSVDKAMQVLPESQRQSPQFVLQVISELLDAANSEYGAAIANDKIAAIIEYQDSRGFVNYADTLLSQIAEPLKKANPEAQAAIAENMTKLKTAWPSAQAPTKPVMSPEQVSQLIETIEQNAQKVLKG